jgi:peptidoglycan/xylan/chitin deacetylase (PgdA/CDA1 family)
VSVARPPARVYRRRRLVAAASALVAVLSLALVAAGVLGGSGSGTGTPLPGAVALPGGGGGAGAVAPHIAAGPPRAVPLPSGTQGTGPLFAVAGGHVQRFGPAARREVALTFDDGPGPQTGAILDELDSLHAAATFFVICRNALARPDLVRRMRAQGMVVGDHTWSHPPMSRLSASAQRWQLRSTQREIARIIGVRPLFFRPPMWMWDATTAREVASLGMVGVLFTVETQDWRRPGVQAIVDAAMRAGPGAVIALHDAGGDRTQTLDALPEIVQGLRAKGLEPVTLDRLYGARAAGYAQARASR